MKIEISHRTIIFTVVFVLLLNFFWIMRDLIFSLLIAFIIMSALKPFVSYLVKFKIPRILATLFVYFIFLGIFFNLLNLIFPPLIKEITSLVMNLPQILQKVSVNIAKPFDYRTVIPYIPNITLQFIDLAKVIFSNTVFTISTIFFGFYFLLEEDALKKLLIRFFEENKTKMIVNLFNKIESRMSAWFWGELILMIVVGTLSFVGFSLIGIKYVLALAVLAGLLEIVPNFGPIAAAVFAVLIGLSQSYLLGVSALVVSFIIQQLENHLIVPLIMRKAVGINPIMTMIALIVGGRFGGILGVLLAIPVTLFLETFLLEWVKPKNVAENPR